MASFIKEISFRWSDLDPNFHVRHSAYYDFGASTIAHELFHQWFGDYVTCESWSNLTVNESFANYSETLWAEHKYGPDVAADQNEQDMSQYLNDGASAGKNLVRFHYADKEDVFDDVTYQKGGRILGMLRNYLGNEAFYKGLNIYLKTNAFKNGEAQQLRLGEADRTACTERYQDARKRWAAWLLPYR